MASSAGSAVVNGDGVSAKGAASSAHRPAKLSRSSSSSSKRQSNGSDHRRRSREGGSSQAQHIIPTKDGLLILNKYSNDLPPIPPALKYLPYPFGLRRFVDYKPTSLEKQHKRVMHVDTDIGVHVDLIDPSVYESKPGHPRNEKDEALLVDAVDTKNIKKIPKNVGWLRQTNYISTSARSFGSNKMTHGAENKVYGGVKVDDEQVLEEETNANAQVERIERTFETAGAILGGRAPRHPHNPNLTVVDVVPLLPDCTYADRSFIRSKFDSDPTINIDYIKPADSKMYQTNALVFPKEDQDLFTLFLPTEEGSKSTALYLIPYCLCHPSFTCANVYICVIDFARVQSCVRSIITFNDLVYFPSHLLVVLHDVVPRCSCNAEAETRRWFCGE